MEKFLQRSCALHLLSRMSLSRKQVDVLVNLIDEDKNGELSYSELQQFAAASSLLSSGSKRRKLSWNGWKDCAICGLRFAFPIPARHWTL